MGEAAEDPRQQADDVSIRSDIRTVSTIYPEDSISVRHLYRRQQSRHYTDDPQSGQPSVVSFGTEEEQNLYKDFYGRTFSDHDIYPMPADRDEHSRLDRLHLLHLGFLNGLYPEKELVERVLRPKDPPPAILDVGTGSGSWAVDMAKRFPHAEVVGLDLVPPMLLTEDEIPANCRFEIDDANLGLDHFEGFFDLVHVRCADSGLNDVNGWFYEIAKTMRPGGVLIIANGSIQNYDANLNPLPVTYPGEPGFTWIQHLCGVVYEAFHSKGHFAPDNSMYWDDWIRENPNFAHFRRRDYFIPIGPWKPNMSEREVQVANLQREALIRVLHAYKPFMLSQGHQESEVDMWIERSIAEVRDLTLHGHANWEYTIAVRLDAPWQPRPEVSHSEPEPRRKRFVRTGQARSEP